MSNKAEKITLKNILNLISMFLLLLQLILLAAGLFSLQGPLFKNLAALLDNSSYLLNFICIICLILIATDLKYKNRPLMLAVDSADLILINRLYDNKTLQTFISIIKATTQKYQLINWLFLTIVIIIICVLFSVLIKNTAKTEPSPYMENNKGHNEECASTSPPFVSGSPKVFPKKTAGEKEEKPVMFGDYVESFPIKIPMLVFFLVFLTLSVLTGIFFYLLITNPAVLNNFQPGPKLLIPVAAGLLFFIIGLYGLIFISKQICLDILLFPKRLNDMRKEGNSQSGKMLLTLICIPVFHYILCKYDWSTEDIPAWIYSNNFLSLGFSILLCLIFSFIFIEMLFRLYNCHRYQWFKEVRDIVNRSIHSLITISGDLIDSFFDLAGLTPAFVTIVKSLLFGSSQSGGVSKKDEPASSEE